jgi:hypothetical protein
MPLRRSSKSKNRSLNLRQRKEQVRNNVTNIDNTINDVATELKGNEFK